ncbi:MAG: hypothetical protein O3A00_21225 [Planctomycetota bacterium]|nr:hypothetical protein [Planctomycetota bacterium]
MSVRIAFIVSVLLISQSQVTVAQAPKVGEQLAWLITAARATDLDQIPPARAISIWLEIAESCVAAKQAEWAEEFLQRATTLANQDEQRRYNRLLLDYALKVNRLDLAETIAKASPRNESLLDRLDLAKYRRGEKDALKAYPRAKMTFYNALDLARVYIDLGDYKAAEDFVTDIEISKENDPRAVTGIALETIAKRCRANGDLINAKRYADKAVNVAGRLFFTGFALKITQRSIHGTLTTGLDDFAQLGANHADHLGKELVELLVQELYLTQHFDEAKRTTRFLEKTEDLQHCLQMIAVEQAKRGDFPAAYQSFDEITDLTERDLARLGIARALWVAGKADIARKHVDSVHRRTRQSDADCDKQCRQMAMLYGLFRSRADIEGLLVRTKKPLERASRIVNAIQGYVESETVAQK